MNCVSISAIVVSVTLAGSVAALAALAASPVRIQETPPKAELKLATSRAKPGSLVTGKVVLTFSPGLHAYQNPPTEEFMVPVKVEGAAKGMSVKPSYPKGVVKEFMGVRSAVYEGTIEIPVAITLPKSASGRFLVRLKVAYQQCDDTSCYPPNSLFVSQSIVVKP